MTWLYIPNIEPSPSAPEPEASNLASSLPDPERAASLTWRGKHMQPRHWSRAWKRDSWLRRLSGLTLPPSTLARGAAAFIASLPEIHAKRTVSRESASALPARASSLPRSFGSPTSAGLIVSSERTCRGMRTDNSKRSSQHWSDWATALRLEYSARPESEERTDASGCSSWPTPMAGTPAQNGNNAAGNSDFSRKAMDLASALWPTPRTITDGGESAERKQELGRTESGGGDLQASALTWSTPRASVDQLSSAPDQATPAGPTSSPERRTLNPLFVEWLMGWPIGWTDCDCAETGFTLWQQRMRGLLSTLCSRTPRQATLL